MVIYQTINFIRDMHLFSTMFIQLCGGTQQAITTMETFYNYSLNKNTRHVSEPDVEHRQADRCNRTKQLPAIETVGWFGVAVTVFATATKLSYVEPG